MLLALSAAIFYGAADFFGGLTARRANTIATVVSSQFVGLVLLLGALPFLPTAVVSRQDWWWGACAGVSGGVGVAMLYRALAIGTMAVVAPITAVVSAIIPVLFGFAMGERVSVVTAGGIVLALVAIVMVSQQSSASGNNGSQVGTGRVSPGVLLALLAGVVVGVFFLSLARTTRASGMWPLVVARLISVTLFAMVALVTGKTLRMRRPASVTAAAGGALDMLGNVLMMIAARVGPLSIVVTLVSLYPASTVILARFVLGERLSVVQNAGIACALVAVIVIVGTAG
ncbi:MAG: EamA/RhaT family transporter [Chthoniobacterales bacterium]|nr:MAG: EamA/RhaT family transporter [Chthoniobacterales bacterium]